MGTFDYAGKIAKLIAMAEDESMPEATRSSYREMAEGMMRKYRIAEEEAIATESTSAVPVSDDIVIMESNAYANPLRSFYWSMWSQIASHCGIRTAGQYTGRQADGTSKLTATAVGYEGDIRYAELLYTAARLVFLTRIDARVDRGLTDQLNCYYMRASGLSRKDIATALWGSDPTDGTAHGKVQKMYMTECAARKEVPKVSGRGIQADVYRQAYARGFTNELGWRLQTASEAVDKLSGGLVLHGRKERVDEAFYQLFPHHRPMTAEKAERIRKIQEEQEANCEGCRKTKSKTGKCEAHRPTQISQESIRRYNRLHDSFEARAGHRAGSQAAAEVHISRSGEQAARKAEAAPERARLGA